MNAPALALIPVPDEPGTGNVSWLTGVVSVRSGTPVQRCGAGQITQKGTIGFDFGG